MGRQRAWLLGLLVGVVALMGCSRTARFVAPPPTGLISLGMSESEVVQRLGPPGMIIEQPRVATALGGTVREKRRYAYYYPGTAPTPDILVTFEDGVVVARDKAAR